MSAHQDSDDLGDNRNYSHGGFVVSDFKQDNFYRGRNNRQKWRSSTNKMSNKCRKINNALHSVRIQPNSEVRSRSLHILMRPPIILAQCLSLMPLAGICNIDPSSVRFNWNNWRTFYSFVLLVSFIIIFIIDTIAFIKHGLTYTKIVRLIYRIAPAVINIIFIQIAKRWENLLSKWGEIEQGMDEFDSTLHVHKKIKYIIYYYLLFCTVGIILRIAAYVSIGFKCIQIIESELIEAYHLASYTDFFYIVPYNMYVGIFMDIMSVYTGYIWGYIDVFIITLSFSLSARFKQLNSHLNLSKGKKMSTSFWQCVREMYNDLSTLTKTVDKVMSPLILFVYATKLYFICLLIFLSIRPADNIVYGLYMAYTVPYELARVFIMSMIAASIRDESKKPLSVLFSVPTESYCIEVERFQMQVTTDDLALTGYNFFSVTRTLILTIAGTILTYVIVLAQFNASADMDSPSRNFTLICSHQVLV